MQRRLNSAGWFVACIAGLFAHISVGSAQDDWVDEWADEWADEWEDDEWDGGFEFGDDDGFVFGEEEVQPVSGPTAPVARYLQEGIQYYEADDYYSASIFFWRVVNEMDISADSLRPRAEYELAKTLVQMRLLQGALYYFDQIIAAGPSHPYFEAAAPWLIVIGRRLPGDADMLRRVSAFSSLFPDRIEEKYRDEMAFMLGQHFYNVGELDRALQYLDRIATVSPYFPKALYLAGVTHVRLYNELPALGRFTRLGEITQRTRGDEELELLAELTTLSMARTYYSAGDYRRSIEYYSRLTQNDRYWLDSLLESSWAYFQLDQYNRALGNLHSLNSPFFNDRFYPEAPILQAVIFFVNCRFEEVRATIDEFNFVYRPIMDELDAAIGGLVTNTEHYEFLIGLREEMSGRGFDPKLASIVEATLTDRTIRNALAFVDELDREMRYLETTDPGWANSDLANYLRRELATTHELAMGEAGTLVRSRLHAVRDELAQSNRDAQAILVESDLAEGGVYGRSDEMSTSTAASPVDARRSPQQMYWRFDGEYWKDELGYYYYGITSACQ